MEPAHRTYTMETAMPAKTTLLLAATLLCLLGCRENQVIDPNNAPEARAMVEDEDASDDGSYEFSDTSVTITLSGAESEDRDGEVVEYIWISGTLDPEGSGARYVPDGEDADWPSDGRTTTVDLDEGFWTFHLYVKDDSDAISSPATLNIKVGDPEPIPVPGAGSGDGAGGGDCVGAVAMQTMDMVTPECAECACGGGGTCAADVAACDDVCWSLIQCIGVECADDASQDCVTAAATGACAAFLGGAATATPAGACVTPCADVCRE